MAAATEELRGEVTRTFMSTVEFSAGKIRDAESGRIHSFGGKLYAKVGDRVVLIGGWEQHPKFGRQFKVDEFRYDVELDAAGLADFLATSKSFHGIGPVRARRIVDTIGADNFEEALREDPGGVARRCQIPLSAVETLAEEWQARIHLNRAMSELHGYGLTPGRAKKLFEAYGASALGIIRDNPYWLIGKVYGFGFLRVDEIALKMGGPKNHPDRIRHAILHAIDEEQDEGHTWTQGRDLLTSTLELLALDQEEEVALVTKTLNGMAHSGDQLRGFRKRVFRSSTYEAESWVWEKIRGAKAGGHWGGLTAEKAKEFEGRLDDDQAAAVAAALSVPVSVITGGAGVGKTFAIATIVAMANTWGRDVGLCAPTGKAAQRMAEVIRQPACSVHRFLEPEMIRREGEDGPLRFQFRRNCDNPVDYDVVVVDEVSMVDVFLMANLLEAIDLERTKLVLVGDPNQLPSVGPGAVLRDLVKHGYCPVSELRTIKRQAGLLKRNIGAVLDGRVVRDRVDRPKPKPGQTEPLQPWYVLTPFKEVNQVAKLVATLFRSRLPCYEIEWQGETRPVHPVEDVQLLTPTHKGPLGTRALNIELQRIFQAERGCEAPPTKEGHEPRPMAGDKVVWTKNVYTLGLLNGQMGTVLAVDWKEGEASILFDGEVEPTTVTGDQVRLAKLAYAMTVHKAQGSEFPIVVAIVHKAHSFMHHRGWIYTAVSRSRLSTLIVGDNWGVDNCARKIRSNDRRSLPALLAEAEGETDQR